MVKREIPGHKEIQRMNWRQMLDHWGILLADGAWGTEIGKRGLAVGECPERWNLEHPDQIKQIASSYLEAGAQIVLTNTFGANRLKLRRFGLADRVEEINRVGVELSREAVNGAALVFASIGPTGEFMKPLGTVTETEMIEAFAQQVRAFVAAGADGVVVETMMDLAEARCALRAVRDSSDLPAAVCMTFSRGPAGYATIMGITPQQAATELEKAGADLVGANCGTGIEDMIEVIRLMRPVITKPLWAKPNAGVPELVDGKTVFRQTPEEMANHLPALTEAGARVVGGCCGTTPEHIRTMAEKINPLRKNRTPE